MDGLARSNRQRIETQVSVVCDASTLEIFAGNIRGKYSRSGASSGTWTSSINVLAVIVNQAGTKAHKKPIVPRFQFPELSNTSPQRYFDTRSTFTTSPPSMTSIDNGEVRVEVYIAGIAVEGLCTRFIRCLLVRC